MKRILSIALIALSFVAATADQFMFSRDGVKPGSSLRELPSQGIDLQTGRVIVGLHALDDIGRMACGWYRYEANAKEMGKWAEVKAAMEASGYLDRWNACTYIAADNERFLAIKPAIAQILGVTEKQLDEMLKECIYK